VTCYPLVTFPLLTLSSLPALSATPNPAVATSDVRGTQIDTALYVVLQGEKKSSPMIKIQEKFSRGESDHFTFPLDADLGRIEKIEIYHT
jgi:hypothetical protein